MQMGTRRHYSTGDYHSTSYGAVEKMKESQFQTEFSKRNNLSGCFELKFCKGHSLPFSALAVHQERALLDASSEKGLFHKISDFPVFAGSKVRFNRPKPFDCFHLSNINAYVVVCFWIPRKKKRVFYIKIEHWIYMRDHATRKSMTESMAEEVCNLTVDYLKK